MAPSLDHFPSVCLEVIFSHVPLCDLFYSVGLVCTSWHRSRRTELARRRRLLLVRDREQEYLDNYRLGCSTYGTDLIGRVGRNDGSPWLRLESLVEFKFDLLVVPSRMQSTRFISPLDNFCHITRLILVHACTVSILTSVTHLIDHVSQHLVELKIKMYRSYREVEVDEHDFNLADNFEMNDDNNITQGLAHNVANLFVRINRLQSIRNLELDLSFGVVNLPPLTCLSRLSTFSYHAWGYRWLDGWMIASIIFYAHNDISLEFTSANYFDTIKIQDIAQLDHQLALKFNVLSVRYGNLFEPALQHYDDLKQFCTHFSGLIKLDLQSSYPAMPMKVLAQCLCLLPQLVQLDLRYYHIPPVEVAQPEEEGEKGEQAQVPSVRLLAFDFITKSHLDTAHLSFHEIFPNVQVLSLRNSFKECHVCEIGRREEGYCDIEGTEPELARRVTECKRLSRRPFAQCANLHTVELVDRNDKTVINVNQL